MAYVIRKRATGTWCLQYETYPEGKRTARTIPKSDYPKLGLKVDVTIEQAKSIVTSLNKRERKERWDLKRLKIEDRLKDEARREMGNVPPELVEEFEKELNDFPNHRAVLSNWRAARRLIIGLNIPAEEWKRRVQAIYNYFQDKHLSDAYAKKIIIVMNLWGDFLASRTKIVYIPIKAPSGHARGRIRRAYELTRRRDKASDGLTMELLGLIKSDINRLHWNYLFVSLWFGLRPQEMANLKKSDLTFFSKEAGVDLLNVKQTKLSNLPDEDQWKAIPILYPEQRVAAEIIKKGELKRPLPKTIRFHTQGNHHLYAGRKGFSYLMWDKGHDIVAVSSWLGHKSIDRTYRDYMKWKKLKLRKAG